MSVDTTWPNRTNKPRKVYKRGWCKLKIEAKTGRILYWYKCDRHGDTIFQLDLFSHVGAPYQPYFAAIIREHKLEIETVEVNHRPWMYDRLKGTYDAKAGVIRVTDHRHG